jgi:hypothetical protein
MRVLIVLGLALAACGGGGALPIPTPVPSPLAVVELKYRVFDQVGRPWYCDPDFFPIARANETDFARQRLPEMQKDAEVWQAILVHNALGAGANLTDAQLLTAYHDWKDLRALELQPVGPGGAYVPPAGVGGVYGFMLIVRPTPSSTKQSERVEGRIDTAAKVDIVSKQPAGPPNCPICLSDATSIDTPTGAVRVTDLRVGDLVWTQDASRARVAAALLAVASVEAPAGHEVLRIVLEDGRGMTASPGHPAADGRLLGALAVGEELDGSRITSIERLPYRGRTYDVLPAGPTGVYWANGVLLGSTLKP